MAEQNLTNYRKRQRYRREQQERESSSSWSDWSQPQAQPLAPLKIALDIGDHPVYHIVEVPGKIERLADIECPTEEYYDALAVDMGKRHPKTSIHFQELKLKITL